MIYFCKIFVRNLQITKKSCIFAETKKACSERSFAPMAASASHFLR